MEQAFTDDGFDQLVFHSGLLYVESEEDQFIAALDKGLGMDCCPPRSSPPRGWALAQALSILRPIPREVVLLRLHGLSFGQIALQHKCTKQNVFIKYTRALRHLRAWVDNQGTSLAPAKATPSGDA